jgi:hypothetical protein
LRKRRRVTPEPIVETMIEAEKNRWPVDVFVVYTDNETWSGTVHPSQALRRYRERTGIAAKLVVVAMASNGFSIADPADPGMLDVVGFDAATPALTADFGRYAARSGSLARAVLRPPGGRTIYPPERERTWR